MAVARRGVGDALVDDDDLGRVFARLEADGHALARSDVRFDIPCVDEPARRLDDLELAGDSDDAAVGKPIGDPITGRHVELVPG